jgi:hypothetical protein
MNFLHPLAIMVYTLVGLVLLCLLASRAATVQYFPSRCGQYCVKQAEHAFRGGKLPNATLQLCRIVSALTYLSAARKLAPDNATLMRDTRVDVAELQTGLLRDVNPLLEELRLNPDHFRAVVA